MRLGLLALELKAAAPKTSEELVELWAAEAASKREQYGDEEGFAERAPEVKGWNQCYERLGLDPSRYKSRAESVASLAIGGEYPLVPSGNCLEDICFIVSCRYLFDFSLHHLDEIAGETVLRKATPGETWNCYGRVVDAPAIVLADDRGPFASPIWICDRARYASRHKRVLVIAYAPNAVGAELGPALDDFAALAERHAGAVVEDRVVC